MLTTCIFWEEIYNKPLCDRDMSCVGRHSRYCIHGDIKGNNIVYLLCDVSATICITYNDDYESKYGCIDGCLYYNPYLSIYTLEE